MVVCPSQNQPQDQPNEGQPKEAISEKQWGIEIMGDTDFSRTRSDLVNFFS